MNRYMIESERIVTVWYEVEADTEEEAYAKWANFEDKSRTDIIEVENDIIMENFGYIKLDEEDI